MNKWQHIVNDVDNYIWFFLALICYIVGHFLDINLALLSGACLIKVRGESVPSLPTNPNQSTESSEPDEREYIPENVP